MNEKQMLAFMQEMEDAREQVAAVVAGFTADGFTDTQARWLVVGIFTQHLNDKEANEEDQ
jgi:hypothetical protein